MNMSHIGNIINKVFRNWIIRSVQFLIAAFIFSLPMQALVIRGDVYGGGKFGKVGTEVAHSTTDVDILSGEVRTVYGGGQEGLVYGETDVVVSGGTIGAATWDESPFGGVYGGGEGVGATVYGTGSVLISGGTIINNVYGGGKKADLQGNANVHITGGIMDGAVYAGAKMADILGRAYLWIDGSNNKLIISSVYGGNDISGRMLVDQSIVLKPNFTFGVPEIETNDNWKTWNSFVRVTSSGQYPVIGKLYGGGNGDYEYALDGSLVMDAYQDCPPEERITFTGLQKPEIDKTYIDITGGTLGYVYGGGNNATVAVRTDLYFNRSLIISNPSLTSSEFAKLKLPGEIEGLDYTVSGGLITQMYNVSRMFGGNNKADMAIRPNWHLVSGSIGDLYSGGNEGDMTNTRGIYVGITSPNMTVNNVYGGCRMADVNPTPAGTIAAESFDGYTFDAGYAARVLVSAGNVRNVYGGNDISGKVQYGTDVYISGIISGDVYGGGNGSYAYTDNLTWATTHPEYADLYYNPGANSLQALNSFRPNVERSLVHIQGASADYPAIVGGSVYCGGNSATLMDYSTNAITPSAIFRIGKNVRLNKTFLGSNGINMIDNELLSKYANNDFSSLDLTDSGQFATYMEGASSAVLPVIAWSWGDAETVSAVNAYIGSFICGGNIGNMTISSPIIMNFPEQLVIFSKIVGGCNTANIAAGTYNAVRLGGVTVANTGTSASQPKITLNVRSVLEPRVLILNKDANNFVTSADLTWSTSTFKKTLNSPDTEILSGANIYGGCYSSGYVNGDVTLNISENLISGNLGEKYYIDTNIPFGDYVFSTALNAFGGGYGIDTEIRGNTRVNISDRGRIMKAFGGGEMGIVSGNTQVTSAANLTIPTGDNNYNVMRVYAGGMKGYISGNTRLNLEGGKLKDAFGGSCVADIGGSTYVKTGDISRVGDLNNLYVKGNIYGGNDFGGSIIGNSLHAGAGNGGKAVRTQTMVSYQSGLIDGSIFGAANGSYNYDQFSPELRPAVYPKQYSDISAQGDEICTNSFVLVESPSIKIDKIKGSVYGGGLGYAGYKGLVDTKQTYVRLNATGSYVNRTSNAAGALVENVYGGGYYSYVYQTLVDGEKGYYNTIFGGTVGQSHATLNSDVSYNCNKTYVNVYEGIENTSMHVFGAGFKSGVDESTNVTLYGGNIGYVFGGSYNEGGCLVTNVIVPAGSTFKGKALYGGSVGSSDDMPCDVGTSNVTLASVNAYLSEGLVFGGNRNYRATDNTNITIGIPMLMSAGGDYLTIYGAGDGEHTIAGHTNVNLLSGAIVNTVYGAARNGKVYNRYDNKIGANAYYTVNNTKYAHWDYSTATTNTLVNISEGARVVENVYGGGYGENATVCGTTGVKLMGGTIDGDIYGGGYAGSVSPMTSSDIGCSGISAVVDEKVGTFNNIIGGRLRNVYGGCYAGAVLGEANINIGLRETPSKTVLLPNGTYSASTFSWGKPVVQRSVYGGGERGRVTTSIVNMNNGYVGYDYNSSTGSYYPKLTINSSDLSNLLKENGNLYGGGYGEGAITLHSYVNMFDGVIRNGLYGGGEIASVGYAKTIKNGRNYILDNTPSEIANRETGDTHVTMNGGLVEGDVFGGGRGFSYNTEGAMLLGEHFYSDGFVFGSTEVNLHRGTIGTDISLEEGHGNVFGGGNIGYVFSLDGTKNSTDGYYYGTDDMLTEDCKVVVSSLCLVKNDITIGGNNYHAGDYVGVDVLNTLSFDSGAWTSLDDFGMNVRNAIFAGGNVTQGTDIVYADAKTVFGNVTASVVDAFDCDFITIGDDGIGGLYGDGNLTLVDGYRELNVTNYGTDYNHLNNALTYEEYINLHSRKKAYYELKYDCIVEHTYTDTKGKTNNYHVNDQITGSVFEKMTPEEKENWELKGFATLYAGRLLNTIQRTDFCGIFGSRIVLKGARDRVTSQADYTNYTLNRIGELSLNKYNNQGCYFGIYSVVNMLGGLTSDVDYYGVRTSDNPQYPADGIKTYQQWKSEKIEDKTKNNGTSKHIVALASGVWLEVVKSEIAGVKDYGYVTGVIQLDLVNVAAGEGGGYLYSKNEHRPRLSSGQTIVTLSEANHNAISNKLYEYSGDPLPYETSGNCVNSLKYIVDDCFPNNGSYIGENASPAHYWFLRGDFYLYNQLISAYTGFSHAYPKTVDIPLTITSGSNSRISIESIKEGKYAYFAGMQNQGETLGIGDSIQIRNKYYRLNDPISYWDWNRLSDVEKDFFTDVTYVCYKDVLNNEGLPVGVSGELGDMAYLKGAVIDQQIYDNLSSVMIIINDPDIPYATKQVSVASFFRQSNSISYDKGFLLTLDSNNPENWNDYYTLTNGTVQISTNEYEESANKSIYTKSPTFVCNENGTYGQRDYIAGDIIDKEIYDLHTTLINDLNAAGMTLPNGQATFDLAYVAKEDAHVWTMSAGNNLIDMFVTPGNVISATDYNREQNAAIRSSFELGYVCTSSLIDNDPQILYGDVIPVSQYSALNADLKDCFLPAYYCTLSGKFGGKLYIAGRNYAALDWNSLNETDRAQFEFNKDALDLIAQNYAPIEDGGYDPAVDPGRYSEDEPMNYSAVYRGNTPIDVSGIVDINGNVITQIIQGTVLDDENFEQLPNERKNYSHVIISSNDVDNDSAIYIVNETFRIGDKFYNRGRVLRPTEYSGIPTNHQSTTYFSEYHFSEAGDYYICKESYSTILDLTPLAIIGTKYGSTYGSDISAGNSVSAGTVLNQFQYTQRVTNKQQGFDIYGVTPNNVTTLYVTRNADIRDLSQDKIVTVTLKYSYLESDFEGNNFEEINEYHVINIRVHFETGVPTIGNIQIPSAVLPGSALGMSQPRVIPGAYEILGGGWEIFTNETDAYSYKNGSVYDNSRAPLYWFQNGYWIAYYAKSYLGKTYSNPVPLTVANYHRMEAVFNHPEHLYIDSVFVKAGVKAMERPAKIYIDNHTCADNTLNELDYLYKFFTDTLTVAGNIDGVSGKPVTALNSQVNDAANLVFILQSDVQPKKFADWNPIGSAGHAFKGELRGDGFTVKGLTKSLFNQFDGKVYNLGAQGTFTGSGIADSGSGIGYAENCWVETSGRQFIDASHVNYLARPVLGNGTIVNSYYISNEYARVHVDGDATPSTPLQFLNGAVSYNLNGFYLQKRSNPTAGDAYRVNSAGNALEKMASASSVDNYVERTIAEGDFRFAKGVVTNTSDVRLDKDNGKYYPIYPDDFIFFGQTLSFGGVQGKDQDGVPERVAKAERTFVEVSDHDQISHKVNLIDFTPTVDNRVFRAPGYYLHDDGSLSQRATYFNKEASFIDSIYWIVDNYDIDNNLTAIDFTGKNDVNSLLDYEGLNSIYTNGITRNLLIYADPSKIYYSVLRNAMNEPSMNEDVTYHNIEIVNESAYPLFHLVDKQPNGSYVATSDHFLVDKQSFAAPISYTFGSDGSSDCYMWYQRKPSTYAEGSGYEAWEGLVLPFTADLVTTQDKGAITHFYNDDALGHEYWLRGFTGVDDSKATFVRPNSDTGESGYDSRSIVVDQSVSNTYLWDYYYSHNSRSDDNGDTYQQYYSSDRDYDDYVLTTENVPYITAFPGEKYMEFDMSGKFEPQNTSSPAPSKIDAQTVTYVSRAGQQIDVYNPNNLLTSVGNYKYYGTFTNVLSLSGGTFYGIDAAGHGFASSTNAAELAVPFRTYMKYQTASPAPTKGALDYIEIGQNADYDAEKDIPLGETGLEIYSKNGVIHIISSLEEEVSVSIYTSAGQLIRTVNVSPGAHATVRVSAHGVYLVNRKKLVI